MRVRRCRRSSRLARKRAREESGWGDRGWPGGGWLGGGGVGMMIGGVGSTWGWGEGGTRFSFRAELGGSFAGGSKLTTGLFGGDCVVTDLRPLRSVLSILRGSVVGVFQRRAGIMSGF